MKPINFEYAEPSSDSNVKIIHDPKHHSYRITVSKVYHDHKASATCIVPEDEFPFSFISK